MLAVENFQVYCYVYINRRGRLYLYFVGKGMVRQYLGRRVDSGKLYRYTAGKDRFGCGFETVSFTTIVK